MQKSRRYLALSLAIIILLVFGVTIYNGRNTPIITEALAAEITIEPTKQDSGGTDLDTEFILSAKSPLDPKLIRENLTVEPAIDFSVKKDGGNNQKVLVIPREPLEPQKIYRFAMASGTDAAHTWAFQTKGDFKVVSTLPRDQSTGVPVDTGIEITFSHLNFDKLPEFFTISPQAEGTFEIHKKTAVFMPKGLKPDTVYTVTIKKGLPLSASSQVLKEDVTFQFETQEQSRQDYDFNFYESISEFTTDEKPVFQFSYYGWGSNTLPKEMEFVVYQYQDAGEYIKALEAKQQIPFWAYRSRQRYQEDTSKLQSAVKFSVPVMEFDYTKLVEFPETLPAGYYLAETKIQDIRRQVWFQVTDLSLYAAVDKNNTYIWINDLSDGAPAPGAKVRLSGSNKSAVTDDAGLARLTTPKETSSGVYAVISEGRREAVAAIPPWYQWDTASEAQREFAVNYWKYLYLDRTLYKPNDTVHFWGIIKPRAEKAKPLDKVTVSLMSGEWRDNPVIDSKEITFDGFSFTDNIKLPNLTPGYYYLEVKSKDYSIISDGFTVETYSKPAYQLDITPSKKAVYVGDTMNFKVKASFFEGTPAAHIPLEHHIYDYGNGSVTTDDEGNADISFTPKFQQSEWSPILSPWLYLTAKLPESGEITGQAAIYVLNNDISIDVSDKVEGGTATLEMNLSRLTADRVNNGKADPWDEDAFRDGSAANHSVKVKIYREVWEKQEYGKYYDFINKKVTPRYNYQYRKVFESEGQAVTDRDGKAEFSFPVESKESYLVEIIAQDFRGNPAIREHHVLGSGFSRDYDYTWYHLEGKSSYKSGEAVKLSMKQNEAPMSRRPKGFLFFTARDGILDAQVQDTPDFNTVFTQEYIPNLWVRGVYFDGRNYHDAYDCQVMYDTEEKALKIDIETDKTEYAPKDTVEAEIQVTDSKGKPVKALVNVNLVDEALYALQNRHVDILGHIYSDTYNSGIQTTYYTHETPQAPGGAEGGGEGGSERKDFKDAVLFETLSTDKHGKASVSFKVPDNLTSWRLTCQAVTDDLSAATKTAPIVVKLPFFVDMAVNDTYLAGDQPVISLRAFGDKLKTDTSVSYEAVLKGEKKNITKTLSGKAYTMTQWPLPPLEKGKYELTVTGKTDGGLTDTLTLSFDVVDSFMTKRQVDFWLLDKGLQIKGSEDTPTSLTFTDYERSQYLNMLFRLKWADGSRIEQKIAPHMAQELLEQYFPDMVINDKSNAGLELSQYQTPEGGIAVLPYSGADLELSAKLAALYGGAFDRAALTDYFCKIAQDPKESRERSIIAVYGLSALDEPVLTELNILSEQKDLTVKEQLYLALASLEVGDEPSAAQWIKTVLKAKGEDLGTQLRINIGQDRDDILEATALAAIAGAGLNLDEQNKLQAYLLENSGKDILLYTEQLMFLKKALPRLPEEAVSFDYQLDGKQQKVALKPKETFSLLLAPEKLAALKFDNIKGRVGVTAVYPVAFNALSEPASDEVKVTRTYEASGRTGGPFDANDIIKINISYEFGPKAPDGPYIITDFLPAGLKIIERPYYRGEGDNFTRYPVQIDGQKITFVTYDKQNWHFNYYARVINPGEFKAEPAIIQHMKTGKLYSVTKGDGMSIK